MVGSIEDLAKLPRLQVLAMEITNIDAQHTNRNNDQRSVRKRKPIIPMSQQDLDDFWDDIDEIDDEDDSDYNFDYEEPKKKAKKKKKKKRKGLTSDEVKALNKQKAQKKARENRERLERMRAEKAEAEEKAARRKAKARKEAEIRIIQLIARKNYLNSKLSELDPGREKDARKIACINIELREIESNLSYLQSEYGIYTDTIEDGSKLGRFMSKIKRKVNVAKKKVKKFFKNNKDFIVSLSAVVLPFIGGCIVRMLVR